MIYIENLVPEELWQLLMMAGPLSVLVMSTLQRAKQLPFIKDDLTIWLANLILSFALGLPYYLLFFTDVKTLSDITLNHLLTTFWLSVLTFIGAPVIYGVLREQTLINLQPKTLTETKRAMFRTSNVVDPLVSDVKKSMNDTTMGDDA